MAIININGIIGQDYTYKQFITDYANAGDEQIRLLIDSPGGEVNEGEQIAEFIRQHATRFESVMNSGDVASIAASIFLALPFEKRFFDSRKGVALIHQPFFMPDENTPNMTADVMITLAAQMKDVQETIKKYIAKQTGADADVVDALMAINEPLSESQLESIHFANIIKFQAVAYFKQNDDMTNEELKAQLGEQKSILDKILAYFKPKFVALMLTDANGNQVEFPELGDGEAVTVGAKTTAPDGELVMADGYTYVIAGGVVTEIKEPEVEPTEDVEALKAELAALKAENETLKSASAQMEEVKAQVVALQGKIKSQMASLTPTEPVTEPQPTKFTYNGRKK